MKIRAGFVSNSSSSSFVCCLSGETAGGMDVSLSDCGMVACVNGHEFLEEYRLEHTEPSVKDYRNYILASSWNKENYTEELKMNDEDFIEWFEDELLDEYESEGVPSRDCPVCSFEDLPYEDVAKWYLKTQGITRKHFASQMKESFGSYSTFTDFIKVKKE